MRYKIGLEEVEIPEGHEVCPRCEGRGQLSKYDQGWTSVLPSAELAALKDCVICHGLGHRKIRQ